MVATVFTASVREPEGFALACQLDKGLAPDIDYMALRRDEDADACAAIGAEPLWLPFVEAPHRGYHSATELFAGLHLDDGIVGEIGPALAALIRSIEPDRIFAPQSIGAHVDHVAVYEALRSCDRPLRMWADYPYSSRSAAAANPFSSEREALGTKVAILHAVDLDVKARAIGCYASQLAFQFGGAERVGSLIKDQNETFVLRGPPEPTVDL